MKFPGGSVVKNLLANEENVGSIPGSERSPGERNGNHVHGFPRQEYWSELPFPSPRDLPDPGIELASAALAGGFLTTEPPWKPIWSYLETFIT